MKRFFPLLVAAALLVVGCDNSLMDGELQPETTGGTIELNVDTYGSHKSMALNYASSVVSATQGVDEDGGAVPAERSDPNTMLGAPDGEFFSLGFDDPNTAAQEGEAILDFTTGKLLKSLTVTVTEATIDANPNNPYPLEAADVYVGSNANGPWTKIGTARNDLDTRPAPETTLSVDGQQCVRYVRLVDVTDPAPYADRVGLANGFDVDAVGVEDDGECQITTCVKKYYLWVGFHIVGKVYVEKFDGQLKVTYKILRDGWRLDKTHLQIGESLRDIPRERNGYPKLDRFDHKTDHSGNVTEYSYMVPFSGDPSTFVIAAHAVVAQGRCKASAFAGKSLYCWWMSWVKYIVFKCDPDRHHDDDYKDHDDKDHKGRKKHGDRHHVASGDETQAWEESWDGTGVFAWDPEFKGTPEGEQIQIEN